MELNDPGHETILLIHYLKLQFPKDFGLLGYDTVSLRAAVPYKVGTRSLSEKAHNAVDGNPHVRNKAVTTSSSKFLLLFICRK